MMSPAESFGVGKAEQVPRGRFALCSISHPPSQHEATGLGAGQQRNGLHGFRLIFLVHTTRNGTLKGRVLYRELLVFEKKLASWDLFLEVFATGAVCPFLPLLLLPGPIGPPPSVEPLACNQQALVVSPRWHGPGWPSVFSCPGIT